MEQAIRQATNRKLVTCSHGISPSETCWWCETTKNKPVNDRIDIIEQRFEALLGVIKLLLRSQGSGGGSGVVNASTTIIQNSLIKSGPEADRPDAVNGGLAFWMSTDTDTIYQRRDNTWINISFSRPTAPDLRITDISIDGTTGALQVTDAT